MGRGRRGGDIAWPNQTAPEEWAVEREMKDLAIRIRVAAAVSARQGGHCCWEGCEYPIISYPHAIPHDEGGADDEVNRCGVCASHQLLMRGSRGSDAQARAYLVTWLKRYYEEKCGMAPEVWEQIARGRPPAELGVAGA